MQNDQNAPFFVDTEVIRLTKNGIWMSDETEITHEPTRRLFAKSLKKKDDGYYLAIGKETKKIVIEDTAYFITRIDGDMNSGLTLSLSNEAKEKLVPSTLKYKPGRLTCLVLNQTEEAKFLHAAYFDILRNLEEDDSSYYLTFNNHKTVLLQKGDHA